LVKSNDEISAAISEFLIYRQKNDLKRMLYVDTFDSFIFSYTVRIVQDWTNIRSLQ